MDTNIVVLSGRLGQDSELKYTNSGYPVLNFSLANSPNYKKQDQVSFFRCVLWGKRAESMAKYLTKGTAIIVDGQIVIEKYQKKSGDTAYMTKINIGGLNFAPTNRAQNTNIDSSADFVPRSDSQSWHGEKESEENTSENSEFGDEIPF